jgi:hypothetical protein
VVVGDFDLEGLATFPAETKSVLIVDTDGVLTLSVPFECVELIAGRDT